MRSVSQARRTTLPATHGGGWLRAAAGGASLNLARGVIVVLVLLSYRLARCWLAVLGLALYIGTAGATLAVLLAALLGYNWLLRAAAFIALVRLWHWPWPLALVAAVPRVLLVLPGLVTTALARLRHPRPLWPVETTAAVSQPLAETMD